MQSIILPTLNAMNAEGRTFRGCLYFGLMLTPNGPRVIEYNCRFGDPETQAVLPLVEGDLLEIMIATQAGTLDKCEIKLSDKSSCCLVLASGGYPEKYEKGKLITFDGDVEADCGVCIFHAGTKLRTPDSSEFVTSGGRVLGITAVRDTLEEAVRAAYAAAERVHFDGKYSRSDIGLSALRESRLKTGKRRHRRHLPKERTLRNTGNLTGDNRMVYRIYSEKRPEFSEAAEGLAKDIREFLGIRTLEGVRIINRYDAEGVDEATFNACIETVFPNRRLTEPIRKLNFVRKSAAMRRVQKFLRLNICPGSLTSGRIPQRSA